MSVDHEDHVRAAHRKTQEVQGVADRKIQGERARFVDGAAQHLRIQAAILVLLLRVPHLLCFGRVRHGGLARLLAGALER